MTEGMVALKRREPSRVEIPDLDRVIETAQSRLSLSKNTLSVHTIPVRYFLDDRSVDEPLNMTGMRLEMALQTVSVPKTYVQNVITCVEDARIHVEGLVIKPLASQYYTSDRPSGLLLDGESNDIRYRNFTVFELDRVWTY